MKRMYTLLLLLVLPSPLFSQAKQDTQQLPTGSPNPEAQQLYLKGREIYTHAAADENAKSRVEGLKIAIEYFEQAIAKDPKYASAYVGLAQSFSSLQLYGASFLKTHSQKSRQRPQRHLRLIKHWVRLTTCSAGRTTNLTGTGLERKANSSKQSNSV